jgi:hypothetical protein
MVIVPIVVSEIRPHTLNLVRKIYAVYEGMRIRWRHFASNLAKRRS